MTIVPARRWWRIAAPFVILVCTGCFNKSNSYRIEITALGSGLERRVSIEHQVVTDSVTKHLGPILGRDEIDRLVRVYGFAPDSALPYSATARFQSIPDDVGNWGEIQRLETLLGTTWIYSERFRGDPDPPATLARRFAVVDSMVDLVSGWLAVELRDAPGLPSLLSFVHGALRRQLMNVSWIVLDEDLALERVMIDWREHPAAYGLLLLCAFEDPLLRTVTFAAFRQSLAQAMGTRGEAAAVRVPILATPDSASRSLCRHIARIRGTTVPAALALWQGMTDRVLSSEGVLGRQDSFEVVLRLPVEPSDTNGRWDKARARVIWKGSAAPPDPDGIRLPFVCRAAWDIPDSTRQRRLFGHVQLDGENLESYCLWFSTLDEHKRREWNRMVLGLRPGSLRAVERFRFSDEPPWHAADGDSATSLADEARKLILE